MSKTNIFTLIATILLGALLYTISRFTGSLPEAPPATSIRESAALSPPASADPPGFRDSPGELPRVSSNAELLAYLNAQGIDGQQAIADSAIWLQERGFFATNTLLGITEEKAPGTALASMDDERLQTIAEAGNSGASQALAARVLFTDPFTALDLYRTAAGQGSVYAILQTGALLESLHDLALDEFVADPAYLRKLSDLRSGSTNQNPKFAAFSHAVAAARDGGVPIIDTEMLQWIKRLSSGFSASEQQSACERSAQLFLEFGSERRRNGLQPISTDPPEVFLSIPELEAQLPCKTTQYPIIQLLDLSSCSRTLVQDGRGERMELNICKNEQGSGLLDLEMD